MGEQKVWVEIKNGLPRSAIGERPSLGKFERYVPASELEAARVRIAELEAELAELLQAIYDRGFHHGKRSEVSFDEEFDVH